MAPATFAADLERYGPQAAAKQAAKKAKRISLRKARRYCRRLAKRHYENFTIASRLLPSALRQHFTNIYAYCRWADDLADEAGEPRQSLALLDWWEGELRRCYQGKADHPVFIALAETIGEFSIPADPFVDLLAAFRQDQQVTRYETPEQVLNYCRYSANPVGRLVLYLGRCHDVRRCRLADSVCTGLQLANFCQDVALDWARSRVYLPQSQCRRFGYDEAMFARHEYNEAFRHLLAAQVAEAEGWLRRGLPLVNMMPTDLRLSVALFIHGGLAILSAIRQVDYDVWAHRPVLSKWEKLRLAMRCWWRLRQGTLIPPAEEPP